MSGLRDLVLQPEYRSGTDDVVDSFFTPVLGVAREYWRAVGYFSSTAFEVLGAPLGGFVAAGGTMRLVTSVELSGRDIAAIEQGLSQQAVASERLIGTIVTMCQEPVGQGAVLLANLLAAGRLEIRIAVRRGGCGIYHEKVGLFFDAAGDAVVFFGSQNESRQGLEENYECIDIYTSWADGPRARGKREHFERLWRNEALGAEVFAFPEAARRELLRVAASHGPSNLETPAPSAAMWRHQDEAIAKFLAARRGVLEMATGTGKTRVALRVLHQLLGAGQVDSAIVAADGNDLLAQWRRELGAFPSSLSRRLAVCREHGAFHERDTFLVNPTGAVLLTSRLALPAVLRSLGVMGRRRLLLIHDEVHRLGSPGNVSALTGLSDEIPYRLGLSATPEREYDREGTRFIENHVGPVIYQFDLASAIHRGILSPFEYIPLPYTPSQEDRNALQQVYRRAVARKRAGQPMSREEIWMELARVYKRSRAKLPPFRELITQRPGLLERCLIFVETREYGEEVLSIVHTVRRDFHAYFEGEDSSVLQRFARGQLECLVTCHRLSEGIDIRSTKSVILFSSDRGRLETIQRIGRCLRVDPANPAKRATVVDFIRPRSPNAVDDADGDRRTWLEALSRMTPEED